MPAASGVFGPFRRRPLGRRLLAIRTDGRSGRGKLFSGDIPRFNGICPRDCVGILINRKYGRFVGVIRTLPFDVCERLDEFANL